MEKEEAKPTPGEDTERAITQAHMVVPAEAEEPGEEMQDARQGGEIYTCSFSDEETRPQDLHSATSYQEMTADPKRKPDFVKYTELTEARGEVR